ncbi:glycoside hydrolase family 88 protein, partial [Cylindrobasidium torrendii FP15055 ss-10]
MMLKLFPLVAVVLSWHICAAQSPAKELYSPLVASKVLKTYNSLPASIQYPQWTTTSGKWVLFSPRTWTSSFFPTTLYALHTRESLCGATPQNQLGIADWQKLGWEASQGVADISGDHTLDHDVGFLSFPFVEELSVNPGNEDAIDVVNNFATTLAGRFSSVVGCTRSWDGLDANPFRVIMDNMMNLDLLFVSAELTGNSTLREIAITHATTTMRNQIRADGSTWHVIDYDPKTGAIVKKHTAQGYSDSSTWSRGQAWGIYGFTNMYDWTGQTEFLETARRLATYFLNNIPSDGIVPWDFNAPTYQRPADSSAATIAATALLFLSRVETDASLANKWRTGAINVLNAMTKLSWNESWDSLLSNGTVNKPADNYLTGTVYGDYYFVQAGNDLISMGLASCS